MNESPPDNPFGIGYSQHPMAPWHMWGSSQVLQTRGAGPEGVGTSQIAKINYKRPETWSFFCGVKILSGTPTIGGNPGQLYVDMHLILGVGRSVFNTLAGPRAGVIDPWIRFAYVYGGAEVPGTVPFEYKWTCAARTPVMNDEPVTQAERDATRMTYDAFPAQDIQCLARMTMLTGPGWDATSTITAEVSAFFAPRGHTRPDWFSEGEQFRGDEIGGV